MLCQDDNEITCVSVRFSDEELWLTKTNWQKYTVQQSKI
jgi:hypothetical protein